MTILTKDQVEALAGFTEGPWHYIETISPDGQEWLGCGVRDNAECEFFWMEGDPERDIPDAHMIAAAPDLHATCLALFNQVEELANERVDLFIERVELKVEVERLKGVTNQCRLMFAGFVSAQSVINKLDDLGAI